MLTSKPKIPYVRSQVDVGAPVDVLDVSQVSPGRVDHRAEGRSVSLQIISEIDPHVDSSLDALMLVELDI